LAQGNGPDAVHSSGSAPESSIDPHSGAVFISYASQDASAAERLVSALRAAGIDVWFDRSELRGGEAWDRQIRRQIHDCTLFIPIISAHTDARSEGYFRREWRLAVERMQDIADDACFLIPVVIDGTPDAIARVPDRFREVQWTRMPEGATPAAFTERIVRLLSPNGPNGLTAARTVATRRPTEAPSAGSGTNPAAFRRLHPALLLGVACVVLATAFGLIYEFALSKHPAATGRVAVLAAQPDAPAPGSIPDKSIAVLPFADMSEKHDQEYFSDGLAEELLDLLAKTPGLRVIARTSSFYFKGKQASLTEIAKTLNVATILEGSVRKSGNRLRVTTQLIRADTGEHLWSETYDRDLKDIFQVQDDIAGAVVRALKATLLVKNGPGDRTDNMDAYALLLQGRLLSNQGSASDLRKATQVLQRAVELDPNYAAAWAALSDAFYSLSAYTDLDPDVEKDMESARAAVQKALSLNPDNAPAHYSRAIMRIVYEHDPKGAMEDIDAAQRSDPKVTKPFELVIVTGCHSGPCFQKYIREVSRDLELDPLNANTMQTRGWAYWFADNPTASIADLRRVQELNPGINTVSYFLACALIAEHRFPEALAAAQAETNPWNRRAALALAYLALGRRAEADAMIKELLENNSKSGPMQIAEVYSFAGNKTAALDWMERDYEYRKSGVLFLGADPFLRPLSSEPRYIALLKKIGMSTQLPPAG
jgi:TolB-like protein/Flp pilus assembly protein TadD